MDRQSEHDHDEQSGFAARLDSACIAVGRWIVRAGVGMYRTCCHAVFAGGSGVRAAVALCAMPLFALLAATPTDAQYSRRKRKRRRRWSPPVKVPPRARPPWLPPVAMPVAMLVSGPPPLPTHVQRSSAAQALPLPLPYRRAKTLLSKGERAAWVPLYLAVKGRYRLFCKVRLLDVVDCPPLRPGQPNWFKQIRGYHVDFVICDPESTEPLLVIELDDRSHQSAKSIERDRHKDEVLRAAGLPILRIRAQQAYSPDELREQIDRSIVKST